MDKLNFLDGLGMQISKSNNQLPELFKPKGILLVEHFRDGKLINKFEQPNTVVNEGKNHALNVVFDAGTQVTTWYMGLIDNTSFSTVAATDTMSSHAGWVEFTGFSQTTRVAWGAGAASSQTITNASPAVFDITTTGTLRGAFICTNSTKAGTTGTLWSGVTYSSTVAVANGDQIKNTYTITT